MPEDDDEVVNTEAKKKGKKRSATSLAPRVMLLNAAPFRLRRSDSIMSVTTDGDDVSVASSKRGKSKPKTKYTIPLSVPGFALIAI
jgi:hypothetical protein